MAKVHVERERKYAVPDSAAVPADLPGSGIDLGAARELHLDAVYFDTPELDLLRRGISLRRRAGGDDEGWHVKIPRSKGTKLEVHRPLGRAVRTVPHAVKEPVLAVVRGKELVPVARISTRRTVYPLAVHGKPAGLLCDDVVVAHDLRQQGTEHTWREWEVEVLKGHPSSVIDEVEPFLLESGAHRSRATSKLQSVLAADVDDPVHGSRKRAAKGDARAALAVRLAEQTSRLLEHDAAFRVGADGSVHGLRIAARRLRSALTSAKPLFDDPPEELREELRWFGQQLGPARDAQVVRERLKAAVSAEPDQLVLGPVRRRLDVELGRRSREATATAADVLRSDRYFRLVEALDALVGELADSPGRRARVSVTYLVRRDAKRLRRAVRAVDDAGAGGRDLALHEARKKAKRLRYAAELAAMAGGRRAPSLAKRAKAVQSALGDHQDTVVARQVLRDLGAAAFTHGENGFTFGLLAGAERLTADQAERRFRAAWKRMPSPRKAASWVTPH